MRRDVFQAIADPTRRAILSMVARQSLNINSVAENFEVSRTAIYKHIKILTECGLIVIKQQGRERYCEARLEKLSEVLAWVEPYRKFWTKQLDFLEEYLKQLQTLNNSIMTNESEILNETAAHELVIIRTFDAPRELVFQAFTKAEHLIHWWGPIGFRLGIAKLVLRPGGIFHYSMQSSAGHKMWGLFVYREIVSPERIVFTNSFADEEGNITRAPFSASWPLEILNTWTLTEQHGKTTLTLRGEPINATEEECKTFKNGFASMRQGFKGTFDQLADYLAKR